MPCMETSGSFLETSIGEFGFSAIRSADWLFCRLREGFSLGYYFQSGLIIKYVYFARGRKLLP